MQGSPPTLIETPWSAPTRPMGTASRPWAAYAARTPLLLIRRHLQQQAQLLRKQRCQRAVRAVGRGDVHLRMLAEVSSPGSACMQIPTGGSSLCWTIACAATLGTAPDQTCASLNVRRE